MRSPRERRCIVRLKAFLPCVFLLLISFGSAGGAVIYVPDDEPTIQDAIDSAANGDTIIVRPGTYVERIDFDGKGIAVVSENGPG